MMQLIPNGGSIKQDGDKRIDDYTSIILVYVIPDSYSDVKSTIKYGGDEVTLDIVVNVLKSKELDSKQNMGHDNQSWDSGEALSVRGRSKSRSKNPKKEKKDRYIGGRSSTGSERVLQGLSPAFDSRQLR
ncbi:unnamed protein product [Cuscuta europaea]|uniref:Uncharacterized protein n=1 Tax=Cuscuta europaea TaxID=41803 RepID=A0A9P0YVB0_CUSEU|nr:unnamed protein product [Cuscuta europaea]